MHQLPLTWRASVAAGATLVALTLAHSASAADADPPPDMARCAKTATALAWAADGVSLDFSAASLAYVDQTFLRLRNMSMTTDQREMLVGAFGCYVGEVLIRELGGAWYFPSEEERKVVQERALVKSKRLVSNPLGKARKLMQNGIEDSVRDFFQYAKEQRAKSGELPAAGQP